jgi:L-threonylcarbamoyladenylate synthase
MKEKIEQAAEVILKGGTILYPTDTIWGLGCDATNEEACQKIMTIKNRPAEKSFVLLADSFRMVEFYIPEFAEIVYDLVDIAVKPMTIIYPKAQKLAPSVLATDGSVGIRITQDPLCRELIRKIRKPLVSTSANLSGQPFATKYSGIDDQIKKGVDYILDERIQEEMNQPSQIIRIDLNGSVQVIRH